jgi:hypothetical protein
VLVGVVSPELITVLEDINALCAILNSNCNCGDSQINEMHVDNAQASIESRLTNLLYEARLTGTDPVNESCIYAAYLCTYKLSTEMWEASLIPSFCSLQLLAILQKSEREQSWDVYQDLLLWLIFVGGAFAEGKLIRLQYMALIHGSYRSRLGHLHRTWLEVERIAQAFIWSSSTFEQHFKRFWNELHP